MYYWRKEDSEEFKLEIPSSQHQSIFAVEIANGNVLTVQLTLVDYVDYWVINSVSGMGSIISFTISTIKYPPLLFPTLKCL